MVGPNQAASWAASLTYSLNFRTSTSKQSFGDFFVENFQWHFFFAWFFMQDVCIHHCQVDWMKETFLPPFYCLPCKCIIGQYLVWSVHTGFILVVINTTAGFILLCALLGDGASTSTSWWAVVSNRTSRTSFHLMAKRWTHWSDIFSPFFSFTESGYLGIPFLLNITVHTAFVL